MKSENARKRHKNNENDDSSMQTEMVERSKTKMRDSKTSEATRQSRKSRNSEDKKELKRKRSSNKTTPQTNFFNLLDMEKNGRVASAEEDMRMERRLAKKLKVKSGRLTNANDDIDMLLEGISSAVDNFGEEDTNAHDPTISLKSKMMDSAIEDSDEEIISDEGSEESDSAIEDLDDEISSGEGSEESDSLTSTEEHEDVISPKDSNNRKRNGMEFEEEYLATDYPKKKLVGSKLSKKHGNSNSAEGQEVDTRISSNIEGSGSPKTVSSEAVLDKLPNKGTGKYVAPHLRSRGGNESAEYAEVRKRVRGMSLPFYSPTTEDPIGCYVLSSKLI